MRKALHIIKLLSCKYRHDDGTGEHEGKAEGGLFAQLLLKDEVGEYDRGQQAHFIYRHHNAHDAVLNSVVVAEPRAARRKAREGDEAQLFFIKRFELRELALDDDYQPRHDQHHRRADSGRKV